MLREDLWGFVGNLPTPFAFCGIRDDGGGHGVFEWRLEVRDCETR